MQVELAKSAGFCFGVSKAVDIVKAEIIKKPDKPIYTYGPIIHNEQVVAELEADGVKALEKDEIDKAVPGIMIIRSHGVSRATEEELVAAGFTVVDATCPFVKRIHRTVQNNSEQGDKIIIVGDAEHPEVQGIMGWCMNDPYIIGDIKDADSIPYAKEDRITIVSQTTFNYNKFQEIVDYIGKKGYYINVVNTICNATEERQEAAARLADRVDCMIVIGGAHSSNSHKLYEICKGRCDTTYFIQTLDDLHLELPSSASLVGITAGASTPNKIIEEVQNYVRNEF